MDLFGCFFFFHSSEWYWYQD